MDTSRRDAINMARSVAASIRLALDDEDSSLHASALQVDSLRDLRASLEERYEGLREYIDAQQHYAQRAAVVHALEQIPETTRVVLGVAQQEAAEARETLARQRSPNADDAVRVLRLYAAICDLEADLLARD
jgi:hypothetical protein